MYPKILICRSHCGRYECEASHVSGGTGSFMQVRYTNTVCLPTSVDPLASFPAIKNCSLAILNMPCLYCKRITCECSSDSSDSSGDECPDE